MLFGISQLGKPTPVKIKLFGKALAAAVASAASYNTVNGGNVKISFACIALAFIGVLLAEFCGVDTADAASPDSAQPAAIESPVQDNAAAPAVSDVVTSAVTNAIDAVVNHEMDDLKAAQLSTQIHPN